MSLSHSFFFSPFEQFCILCCFADSTGLSLIRSDSLVLVSIFLFFVLFYLSLLNGNNSSFYIKSTALQKLLEGAYKFISSVLVDNVRTKKVQHFVPFLFFVLFYILFQNVIGLFPYNFTLTSHFIVTFGIGILSFLGMNIICLQLHGMHIFGLFFPAGTSAVLAILLVPIEFLSYIFKPISLSTRLAANMLAGHILMKVISHFVYALSKSKGLLFLVSYLPLFILIPLLGLEFAVALIQCFVFIVLICIYLNDALNLHS